MNYYNKYLKYKIKYYNLKYRTKYKNISIDSNVIYERFISSNIIELDPLAKPY